MKQKLKHILQNLIQYRKDGNFIGVGKTLRIDIA
jgi:hypothetical protein